MKKDVRQLLDAYCRKYDFINGIRENIELAFDFLAGSYQNGNKLLVCGNGGSNSDADHIAGELLKGFLLKRPLMDAEAFLPFGEDGEYLLNHLQGGLPVINLGAHVSFMTAMINDIDGKLAFAQQVNAFGREGDILLGISTSGNSADVLYAGIMAKIKGMAFIGLTGRQGGKMAEMADCVIKVPSVNTPDIQDMHTAVYHAVCAMIEKEFWDE